VFQFKNVLFVHGTRVNLIPFMPMR